MAFHYFSEKAALCHYYGIARTTLEAHLRGEMIPAVIILIVSGLTDLFDGKIARRFNQVSALGKILDPIADKLTQASILFCIAVRCVRPSERAASIWPMSTASMPERMISDT